MCGLGVGILVGKGVGELKGLMVGVGAITLLNTSESILAGFKAMMLAGKDVASKPRTKYFQSPFINHKDYNSFDLDYFVNKVK